MTLRDEARPAPTLTPERDSLRPRRTASAARLGNHERGMRSRRALKEFLWLPVLVLVAYLALAAGAVALDYLQPSWLAFLRRPLAKLITQSAAQPLLTGIATSVVTVTSITFSVLLLAVQQSASALTPVVFDQFLRRRGNQLYLGMFVGLSVYAFVVLLTLSTKHPPAIGAGLALVLTVIAFLALIVLIYSTIDQMRPTSVAQEIHDRALRARRRELQDVRRTRRRSEHEAPVCSMVYAEQDGYVTRIDFDGIARSLPDGPASEVTLAVTLGDHVAYGDPLAVVKDDQEARARQAAGSLRRCVRLDRERDLDTDGSFAVAELANIAWTAFSSAHHNPHAGRDALDRLRDLVSRWSVEEQDSAGSSAADPLPIVYEDRDLDVLLEKMLDLLAAAAEARQHESGAAVLDAVATAVQAVPEQTLQAFVAPLASLLPILVGMPVSRSGERALRRLHDALCARDCATTAAALSHVVGSEPPRWTG